MKHIKLYYFVFLLLVFGCQKDNPVGVPRDDSSVLPSGSEVVKGEVRIKFRQLAKDLDMVVTRNGELAIGSEELTAAANRISATRMERVFPYAGKFEARTREEGLHLWYKVVFDENISTEEAIKTLAAVPDVVNAEPVLVPKIEALPADFTYDDPYFGEQWHLYNDGTNDMVAGCDLSILEAWEIEKGKPEVIVAVIDSRVDMGHEDLKSNLWRNPGEYNMSPYMDNDGNGYEGDWHGLGANPYTAQGDNHGTHVAGIIAAKNNNGKGICSIAGGDSSDNGVRIMTCPMANPASFTYAADMGAVICTNSWYVAGGNSQQVYQEAVNYFVKYAGIDENDEQVGPMRGGIVFASAGNENEEPATHYPASLEHVIAVASIGPNFKKSGFSNYADWVDICAPGGADGLGWQIYSTLTNNSYGEMNGTSQATPMAAGVAALIVSRFGGVASGLTPYEVEFRLLRGVKPIYDYNAEYKGKLGVGCVNALLALSDAPVNFLPVITPEQPLSDMQIVAYGETKELRFTVNDREDGADVTYTVEDPTGTVTHRKEGDQIILSLLNRDCMPGDHQITLTVTDQGELSSSTSFYVKLHPEFLQEPEMSSTVTNEFTIRAGMTFSGEVRARFYDATGNLVLETTTTISLSEPGIIDVSGLDGGHYTVKLSCNNKTITHNMIKL